MSTASVLNYLKRRYRLKNDRRLALALGVKPPNICKLRNGTTTFGPEWILRVHDATGLPIGEIKRMLAEPDPLLS
jgi:hypothetical protein